MYGTAAARARQPRERINHTCQGDCFGFCAPGAVVCGSVVGEAELPARTPSLSIVHSVLDSVLPFARSALSSILSSARSALSSILSSARSALFLTLSDVVWAAAGPTIHTAPIATATTLVKSFVMAQPPGTQRLQKRHQRNCETFVHSLDANPVISSASVGRLLLRISSASGQTWTLAADPGERGCS